jgi:hypothetical protein
MKSITFAIAVGGLSAVAARAVHHSEAVPAVVHVGETDYVAENPIIVVAICVSASERRGCDTASAHRRSVCGSSD